jgi:hypothetical protein
MKPVPNEISNATVIHYTILDTRHIPTGKCAHIVTGELINSVAGLAICQYTGEDSYYLFYCDQNWHTLTDTWHATLQDALNQAEFEYEGTKSTWLKRS